MDSKEDLSSVGQHDAEQQLGQEKDPAEIPVQLNDKGQEVFVKVCRAAHCSLGLFNHHVMRTSTHHAGMSACVGKQPTHPIQAYCTSTVVVWLA